mgnify:CR=1 FL=1
MSATIAKAAAATDGVQEHVARAIQRLEAQQQRPETKHGQSPGGLKVPPVCQNRSCRRAAERR